MTVRRWTRRQAVLTLSASALGFALPAWISGCGGPKEAVPPAIAYDRDECDWCRMTIDDPRLVAAFVPASGRALRIGEPGCLLSWLADHRGTAGTPFVVAREDGGWLPAPAANFARGVVRTPMGFDLAAWRGMPAAGAEAVSWSRLLQEGAPRATGV